MPPKSHGWRFGSGAIAGLGVGGREKVAGAGAFLDSLFENGAVAESRKEEEFLHVVHACLPRRAPQLTVILVYNADLHYLLLLRLLNYHGCR